MASKINTVPRFLRKTFLLAKLESTYGTDSVPAAADAILVSSAEFTYTSSNKERNVIKPWMGSEEELVGDDYGTISFTVEAAPSGTANVAPKWGKLLQACALSETAVAAVTGPPAVTARTVYRPVSASFASLTFYYIIDGTRYIMTGCRGNAQFVYDVNDIPSIKFTFTGMIGDYSTAITAVEITGYNYAAWKAPEMVTARNTSALYIDLLGYADAALTAPLAPLAMNTYGCTGLTFDLGNKVSYQPMLGAGASRVVISDRAVTGSITLDLDNDDEKIFRDNVRKNENCLIRFNHGSAEGKKLSFGANYAQLINPKIIDKDGVAMTTFDLRMLPGATGNDEIYFYTA